MTARDPVQPHRVATTLELFFDLVFVVAIAQVSAGLHHAIGDGHWADGLLRYAMVFFAIWWAWMNFTWFASAYDSDDVPYRLTVFVQLTGALVLAAGVPAAFEQRDFTIATFGYAVMRLGTVANWVRASRGDPERRRSAMRYAVGITGLQICWLALLITPEPAQMPGFIFLVAMELLVPAWAESAGRTPWHAHHIAERYGLLTIIVLGESVLAATLSIQAALAGGEGLRGLLPTIVGGLLVLYSMWWLYFDRPAHPLLNSLRRAFVWGYGHYFVYAAAAAVGAGIAVNTDLVTHHTAISRPAAGAAVAVPAAVYLGVLWLLHRRLHTASEAPWWSAPIAVVFLLGAPWTPNPVVFVGLVLSSLLAFKLVLRHRIEKSGARRS